MTQRAGLTVPKRSYQQPCLIAQALDVLGDRWTLIVLRDLMTGLQHFGDILDNCEGLSPNVLSSRLKRLEQEGLIQRHYYRGLPPRVEYELTPKGWAVRPILLSLIDWAGTYLDGITPEIVGDAVSTDFAVRVLPAFAFQPERAADLEGTMVVEITDCSDCNQWTFLVNNGHFLPRRNVNGHADVVLRANTEGFFRYLRGEAPPVECGEVRGDAELAARLQACFSTE